MKRRVRILHGLIEIAGAGLMALMICLSTTGLAQESRLTPTAPTSNALPIVPPFPSLPNKSSMDAFRELLAMSPAERKAALANRPAAIQQQLLAKVSEYQALSPEQRELRLRATELRFYLWPLLNTSSTNRAARLAIVPEEDRALIQARLDEWDKLAQEDRRQLLENEAAVRYLTELESTPPARQQALLTNMPPVQRQRIEAGLRRWQTLSEAQRHAVTGHFNQFFDLTAEEKKKTLGKLSEPERRQIEKTLRAYESLPPNQRAKCVRAFEKFAALSTEERQQFLQNAQQWRLMTPSEREAWKNLVNTVQRLPPMPPRIRVPVKPPPVPPS